MAVDAFGHVPEDSFDFLGQYGSEARPESRRVKPGLEAIPDGHHEFRITGKALKRLDKYGEILELTLQVDGGIEVQHAWWINNQESVNETLADLSCLGFPVQTWAGPKFAQHFQAAVGKLIGLQFTGAKTTRPNKDKPEKPYINLHISGLVKSKAMPGSVIPFTADEGLRNFQQAKAGAGDW